MPGYGSLAPAKKSIKQINLLIETGRGFRLNKWTSDEPIL